MQHAAQAILKRSHSYRPSYITYMSCDANIYSRIVPAIYDELKPLTILDPLLLYGFMYICPKKELPGLFAKVHPFFSMALLSKLLKDSRVINLPEVIKNISRFLC